MMGWGYGSMMGCGGWFGSLAFVLWVVFFIDLVLLGLWLWKQIGKK